MSELLSALDALAGDDLGPAVRTALAPCVHHGFTVVRDADGRWRTYRPDGTEILIHPLII